MGNIIRLCDYKSRELTPTTFEHNCLIPIEFGAGNGDFFRCMELIANFGNGAVQVRPVSDDTHELVYLMRVGDAIVLNKRLLEEDELTDQEIAERIDLIQMLENINASLLENIWNAFYRRTGLGH
ncbi:MAG: hypothetical protein WD772_09930 [Pseudohongiellaceae bacterium]